MFRAIFSNGRCQAAKNQNGLMQRSLYNSLFQILLILVTEAILIGLLLFNFKATQCKNNFDLNLVKIYLAVIEILLILCSVLIFVKAAGCHLGMPNCKNSEWLHAKIIVPYLSGYKTGVLSL